MQYTIKDGYNVLLIADKDVQQMKQKMADILRNQTLRDILSIGAVETFSKSRKTPQIIEDINAFVKNLKA